MTNKHGAHPIRILHIIGSLGTGGIQSLLMNLYRNIDRERVQFDFLVHIRADGHYEEDVKKLGGRIYYIDEDAFERHKWLAYCSFLRNFFRHHPECLIVHGHLRTMSAVYLSVARQAGCRTIAHSHSTTNGYGKTAVLKDILQFPTRYVSDYFMGCSDVANEWMFGARRAHGSRCRVLRNGVDVGRFKYSCVTRQVKRAELGIDDACFVIGNVGRLVFQKAQHVLISAMPQIVSQTPDSKLVIVGDGPLNQQLFEQAKSLHIERHVLLTGNRSDVPDLLSAMDVFAMPSQNEGLGISAIEAQANGLPTLVSKAIPLEAYITSNIHLVENEAEWAKAILSAGGRSVSDASRIVSEAGYDIKKIAIDLMEFYESID